MKTLLKGLGIYWLSFGLAYSNAWAQTDGGATFEGTLVHYSTSSQSHYTVAWVTTASGAFIKSLRKQGPGSWTSSEWSNHCGIWNTARAGSQVLDGFTSATATTYTGTNSPVVWTWNCRDTNNKLVADGNYKFWIQYAENAGQGPYTTNGLLWTKGPVGATNTYPDQGIKSMRVVWSPVQPLYLTSVLANGDNLVMSGTGPANQSYCLLSSTNLSQSAAQWTPVATNTLDSKGKFVVTNTIDSSLTQKFFLLQQR